MRKHWIALALLSVSTGVAVAKLPTPTPTPEQVQAAEAKKEQEKVAAEKEKQLLEQAQDRVVQYYKRTKGGAPGPGRGGKTETTNIPNPAVRQAQGDAGPVGGTKQSAEAHSAPAK